MSKKILTNGATAQDVSSLKGTAVDTNTGTASAGTQRVTLATDIALPTGANVIGQVTANAGTNLNTSALALEAGGNLAGAATSLAVIDDWDETDRAKVNIVVGQAGVTAGAGAVAANTPRTTLASDDPAVVALQVIDDWDESDRAKVNPIVGQAGVAGNTGVVGATTQRVTLATDVALPAGTNAIGKLAANSGVDIGDVDVTSVVPGTGATNLGKAIDTATGSTDTGVLALATRDDALSTLTPAETDNVQLRTDSVGALWTHLNQYADSFTTLMNAQTLQNTTDTDGGTTLAVTHDTVELEVTISKTGSPTRFQVFLKWANDGGTNYAICDHGFEQQIFYVAAEITGTHYKSFVVKSRGAILKVSAQASGTASGSHYFTVTIKGRSRNNA